MGLTNILPTIRESREAPITRTVSVSPFGHSSTVNLVIASSSKVRGFLNCDLRVYKRFKFYRFYF